jgi:hypothetical protein
MPGSMSIAEYAPPSAGAANRRAPAPSGASTNEVVRNAASGRVIPVDGEPASARAIRSCHQHRHGVHLIGPHSEEGINIFALAIRTGLSASRLKEAVFGTRRLPRTSAICFNARPPPASMWSRL